MKALITTEVEGIEHNAIVEGSADVGYHGAGAFFNSRREPSRVAENIKNYANRTMREGAKLKAVTMIDDLSLRQLVSVRKPVPGCRYFVKTERPGMGRYEKHQSDGYHYDEVLYIGDEVSDDEGEEQRCFQSVGERWNKDAEKAEQRWYDWSAYKFNGRWVLGSGGSRFTLVRLETEVEAKQRVLKEEIAEAIRKAEKTDKAYEAAEIAQDEAWLDVEHLQNLMKETK